MRLDTGEGMGVGPGLCCRQSRLRGAVGGLVLVAFLVGGGLLVRRPGAPGWAGVAWTVVAALGALLVLRDVLARFRPTNWVLRVDPDGLWIHLRPLQPPPEAGSATALHLGFEEIARVHRHVDTWSTPSSRGGSTRWKQESLDLDLAAGDTRALSPTLAEARAAGRGTPVSATVPAPGVIRISWRGAGHDVVPGLGRVLDEIGRRVPVAEPTRTDRPDWRELDDAGLEEQVEQFVRRGDTIGAAELLIRRRGCSATEAHRIVTEMATRA